MNLEKIAIKIKIDENLLHYFFGATMESPIFDKSERVLKIKINVTKPLPFKLYQDFTDKMSQTFDNYAVDLNISTKESDISVSDLQAYFNLFMSMHLGSNPNKFLVNLNDDDICILVNDDKAKAEIFDLQDDLSEFFRICGIDNKLDIIKSSPSNEVIEVISKQQPKNEEVAIVAPFNYQQASHYEVVAFKDLKDVLEKVQI